ncbi:hypothetical protein HHI36_004114 [Cryptolaemus montrouzieri]|uniref:Tubulin glycylase 3A n=1 Tax=Cryptolaemus montrouzieri TaxID=559131 RepID=A0ABD2NR14_9CUCU
MSDAVVEKNTFEQLEKSIEKKIQKDTISNENKTLLKKENARKNDGNKVKAKTFSPNTSLDKVAQDIRNILGQLKVNESQKKKKSPIQLKVEQKEFFRAETARKMRAMKQNLARKKTPQNTRRNTSAVCFHKVSRNSIKIASSSKIRSKSLLKPGNLCTIHSNQLLKKIPITISEMNDFKHRVALSANAVSKHPVILKAPEKEKIEKEIKTLVEIASVKSEHTHKVPIIDVGSFINKSLELTTSNDFPGLKKIIEKKTKNLESETGSESEYSEKSIRRLKVEVKPKEKENPKENEATEKNNTIKEPKKDVQKKASLSRRNEDISKSKLASIQPVVQTLKTLPNSGYTNRAPARSSFIQSQSRTTGSLIMHQKSVPFKSTIQKSQVPQKIIPKTNSTLVSSNKPVVPRSKPPVAKQNLSEKPQSKVVNQTGSNINAKSNSALGATISVVKKSHTVHVENPVATLNKTSSSANNSYTSRYTGAFRRRDSVDSTQRRLMSAPTRTLSSISSRLLNGRKYNHFGMGASSHSYFDRKSSTLTANKRSADPIVQLRDEVNRCIRDKKTFTVRGNFPAVRRALLRRGWIEKYHTTNRERLQSEMNTLKNKSVNELVNMLHMKELNEICKKLIKSKLLGNHQVDLYWGPNFESFQINSDKVKLTKINKFRRDVFSYTSKQGLCDAAKNAHWFNFPGLAHIKHPRTYALAKNGETRDFIKDFRRTSAMSLLKWIIKNHQTKECKLISSSGKIPLEAFQFAANECYKMVIEATNQDIDQPLKEATDNEWKQFLEYYYKILHIGNHFKSGNLENVDTLVEKSTFLINKLVPHYPHIKMDGTMNIWILKPAAGSQGRGIHICRTLQYIMDTIQTNTHTHYIAQKYIERPLLIFNTKFDIRQWFLISSSQPLTIWMYNATRTPRMTSPYQTTICGTRISLRTTSLTSVIQKYSGKLYTKA